MVARLVDTERDGPVDGGWCEARWCSVDEYADCRLGV